jgi:hypothetical protein
MPKEAERGAIGLQIVASSQEKTRLYRGVMVGITQGIPWFASQFQRAHLSTKLPVLAYARRQFCWCLYL